jgi:aryl-alcohol dehydrogenase-like predicted oxidoreductase
VRSRDSDLRIGLGLAALARPAYITGGRAEALGDHRTVDDLRRRSHGVLDAAYRSGVRYVDVARSYGYAEEFLASWLHAHPEADDVVIGSKWGYRYVGDWRMDAEVHEVKDHSLDAFVEQLGRTREVLGPRLDVYHVHSATLATGVLDDAGVLGALGRLRAEGVRVGLSTSGPEQAETVRRAMAVEIDGEPLFTSVQSTWNLLEPSAGAALEEAAERGARVIVKEAVANGRLVPGSDDDSDDGSDDGSAGVARAGTLAAELGIGLDQLAVAAALDQPWASCVLSGAVTAEQLASNLAAAELDLPPGWSAELPALAEPAPDYWAGRSRRPWA